MRTIITPTPPPASPHLLDLKKELEKRQAGLTDANGGKQWRNIISKPLSSLDEPMPPPEAAAPIRKAKPRRSARRAGAFTKSFYHLCVLIGRGAFAIAANFAGLAKAIGTVLAARPLAPAAVPTETAAPSYKSALKSALGFAVVLLLLALPFRALLLYASIDELKGKVLAVSQAGLESFLSGGKASASLDFRTADRSFKQAKDDFFAAQEELAAINDILLELAALLPNEKLKLASESKLILAAGQMAATLAQDLTQVVDAAKPVDGRKPELADVLLAANAAGPAAVAHARKLDELLGKIDAAAMPEAHRDRFITLRNQARFLAGSLAELSALADSASIFLGVKQDRRYLLIFQNTAEARATGGFFGSFALVDFSKGKLKRIETPPGGSYDTEGGLRESIVAPPPLQLLRAKWHFWDANWWPDWPTSAKKLAWFYEKSSGPSVDGVLSFTPAVMEDLLALIGPIELTKDYGVVITADNFWAETQRFAEQKPDVTKQPKKIIGDLMNKLMEELPRRLDPDKQLKLLGLLEENLAEKQILAYFNNEDLQKTVEHYGWDGRMKDTSWDYLSVVNSNIGGGKSDRKIRQTIRHRAELQPDGQIIDELEITREHTAGNNEGILSVRNVDWLRIYVPAGAELLGARGWRSPDPAFFDQPEAGWQHDPLLAAEEAAAVDPQSGTKIYRENNKTVFANWSMIDPGETAKIYLRYRLPFKLEKKSAPALTWRYRLETALGLTVPDRHPYALLVQKQAGNDTTTLDTSFAIQARTAGRAAWNVAWHYPPELPATETGWQERVPLLTDQYRAVSLTDN